jgi:hypothetical protein
MMKDTIKKLIYATLEEYLTIDTPTLLTWLYKRYPKYYYVWWTLYQIKSLMIFFIFIYAMWWISRSCVPSVMCKEYVDLINNAFNISNVSKNISVS